MDYHKICRVFNELKRRIIFSKDISPNYVNLIANEIEIQLTSEEVVYISDGYIY